MNVGRETTMEQPSHIVAIEIPAGDRRKPASLEALINAQFSAERWERRLRRCGRLIIAASAPMAYLLHLGRPGGAGATRFVLDVWLFLFMLSAVCAGALLRAQRRVDRLVSRTGARTIERAD